MENQHQYHERVLAERFRFDRCIGVGGFGVVYLARDMERDATVAVKILTQVDGRKLLRFKREFRALAGLVHPNLVTLYELGTMQDVWFFTMEYIDGANIVENLTDGFVVPRPEPMSDTMLDSSTVVDVPSPSSGEIGAESRVGLPGLVEGTTGLTRLADRIDSDDHPPAQLGPASFPDVDPDHVREVLRQLTGGLIALHERGTLHGDIKPSNILVTGDGRVVVLDFGMVQDLLAPNSDDPPEGRERFFAGTPRYASPEQAAGLSVDESSDWYALGAVLYRALTGLPPIDGDDVEQILQRKQLVDPIDIADLRADIPEDLRTLCMDLLSRDPRRRPDGREILSRLGSRGQPSPLARVPEAELTSTTFVGRGDDLERCHEAFMLTATTGKPRVLCVSGRSGMGKSALVRHFLDRLSPEHPDVAILSGRCYETETVPYKGLDELVDELTGRLEGREGEDLSHDTGVRALARLFPVVGRLFQTGDAEPPGDVDEGEVVRQRAIAFLRQEVRRLARRWPTVLFVDDVHWADRDSAELLSEVLAPPAPPVLLILTTRPEGLTESPFLQVLLDRLRRMGMGEHLEHLELRGFSEEETNELVGRIVGSRRDLIDMPRLAADAHGSPFFIDEIARHLAFHDDSAPLEVETVDDVIAVRLERLTPAARGLLESVAVAGRPIRRTLARSIARLGDEEPQAVASLRAERLVRVVGADGEHLLETYHDRVRETVVARLTEEDRRERHRRIVDVLEPLQIDPERLAQHLFEAGEIVRGVAYTLRAADEAQRSFAYDRAAEHLATASRLGEAPPARRHELLLRRGELLSRLARCEEAAAVYAEASELVEGLERLEALKLGADQRMRAGHVGPALDALQRVLETFDIRLPDPNSRWLVPRLLWRRFRLMRLDEELTASSEGTSRRDRLLLDTLQVAGGILATVDLKTAGYCQMLYLEHALRIGSTSHVAAATVMYALQEGSTARGRERAFEMLHEAEALALQTEEEERIRLVAGTVRGVLFYSSGRWHESSASFSEAIDRYDPQHGTARWEFQTLRFYSLMPLFWLGEFERYASLLPELMEDAVEQNNLLSRVATLSWSYFAHLARDNPGQATEGLREASEVWKSGGYHLPHFWYLLGMGESLLYQERGEEAWELVQKHWWPIHTSLLMQVEIIQVLIHHLRGRSALAALRTSSGAFARWRLKRAVESSIRTLEGFGRAHSDGIAGLLRAELDVCRGDVSAAVARYEDAERLLLGSDTDFYAHAARRRRGILLGGEEGSLLVRQADEWLSGQGAARPDRMAAMVTPASNLARLDSTDVRQITASAPVIAD